MKQWVYVLGICAITAAIHAENPGPRLVAVAINAGERGCVLTLETDTLISMFSHKVFTKQNTTQLQVTLNRAWSYLGESGLIQAPAESPISAISVRKVKGNLLVSVTMRQKTEGPVQFKQKEKRLLCLITHGSYPVYEWKSAIDRMPETKAPLDTNIKQRSERKQIAGSGILTNVHLLRRGSVEELVLETNFPVAVQVRQKGNMIVGFFSNAKLGLKDTAYRLPGQSLFKRVVFSRKAGKKGAGVGVIVEASDAMQACVVEVRQSSLVVHALRQETTGDSTVTCSVWKPGDVDTRVEPEKKPSVSVPEPEKVAAKPVPPPVTRIALVITCKKAALRSRPSTDSGSTVIKYLIAGTTGESDQKHGTWYHLQVAATTAESPEVGWVHATLVAESSSVTQEQWKKISLMQKELRKNDTTIIEQEYMQTRKVNTKVALQQTPQSGAKTFSVQPERAPVAEMPPAQPAPSIQKYKVFGRDPFLPLVGNLFSESGLPDVERCKLVGILFDSEDRVALLENSFNPNEAFALREHDQVVRGNVAQIKRSSIDFIINDGGFSRRYSMKLQLPKE